MLEKFRSILKHEFDNFQGKELYLAISGGKDSVCLSQLLLAAGFSHTLLHCNFQLRDPDSDLDERFIENYAKQNQLQFFVKKFDTALIAQEQNLSIQETARNLRYTWFNTFLTTSNKVLLTAHHSDDAIETFFINLMRGTALQGLTGIQHKNGPIYRPLLSFSVTDINSYINQNNLEFRQDQSNADTKYLRNYLRHQIIPAFEQKSDNFKPKVAKTIDSLNQVDIWIQKQAKYFCKKHFIYNSDNISVDKKILLNQDNIFITYIFAHFGIHRSIVENFRSFLNSSTGSKFITDSFQFNVNREQIIIHKLNRDVPASKNNDILNQSKQFNSFPQTIIICKTKLDFQIIHAPLPFSNDQSQQFNLDKINLPISTRVWQHGDRIQPLGMQGSKLISDILIDKKIPLFQKSKTLILIDSSNTIIAVLGLLIAENVKIESTTKNILHLQITNQ
jgi:tRNA(Ile)-lysidine synthase